MNPAISEDMEPLRSQVDDAQSQLGDLAEHLREIDGELAELALKRERYELLAQACGSLEQLGALGAGELFWGDAVDRGQAASHIRVARKRLDGFRDRVAEMESRRYEVEEKIAEGREVLTILEDDLLELEEEEEERQNEWIIERDSEASPDRPVTMAWAQGGEDDRRFRKTLGSSIAAALLLGLLLPLVDLPIPEPSEIAEVPERLVRLIRQQPRAVPPPQPVAEEPPAEQPPPQPEPEPVLAQEPAPVQAPPAETPSPTPAPQAEPPRQRAQSSGILAFRESFSSLADNRPSARLGSDASISNAGDAAIGRPERSMVTTQAPGSSGGINVATLSRDVGNGGDGGPQIAGVQTTRVASAIGPGGGNSDRPLSGGSASAGRTDEEIQIVFDRYKASLYRLYNRELRRDPTLRGQMVLRLTIEPSGVVSMVALQSTDMSAPDLVQQILERVRTFDFGAKDVPAMTIVYPIDFLPAA